MDDELRREFEALRQSETAEQEQYAKLHRDGLARLDQFVAELKSRGIWGFPIGRREFSDRGTPQQRLHWEFVDWGWTIGYPVHYESRGPNELYDATAITQAGVMYNVSWTSADSTDFAPSDALVRGKFLLYVSSEDTNPERGSNYTATHVAHLLRHYIDGAPAT